MLEAQKNPEHLCVMSLAEKSGWYVTGRHNAFRLLLFTQTLLPVA